MLYDKGIPVCDNRFFLIKHDAVMDYSTQISHPEQKYFSLRSAREFAKKFADYDLSEASFYRLSSKGKLPVIKGPGGRLLIPIDAFKIWLEGGSNNVGA